VQGSCCGSRVPLLLHLLEHSPATPVAKLAMRSPPPGSHPGLIFISRRGSSCQADTARDFQRSIWEGGTADSCRRCINPRAALA
jgi:hypothetical protein